MLALTLCILPTYPLALDGRYTRYICRWRRRCRRCTRCTGGCTLRVVGPGVPAGPMISAVPAVRSRTLIFTICRYRRDRHGQQRQGPTACRAIMCRRGISVCPLSSCLVAVSQTLARSQHRAGAQAFCRRYFLRGPCVSRSKPLVSRRGVGVRHWCRHCFHDKNICRKQHAKIAGKQSSTLGDRPAATCGASYKMKCSNRMVGSTRQGISGARPLCCRCCWY